MSKLHNETNINFEEVYVIKKIFYETCLHELKIYVKSLFFLLSGIERSRYYVAVSMHLDIIM